jgi:hypothetical protein
MTFPADQGQPGGPVGRMRATVPREAMIERHGRQTEGCCSA